MIKGNIGKPEEIKIEDILSKISDYEIYSYYLGEEIDFKKKYKSPFRTTGDDKNPNLTFFPADGKVFFKDFASDKSGDCFKFVEKMFNLTFYQTLLKIDKDFNLGIKNKSQDSPVFKIQLKKRPEDFQKVDTLVQIIPKDFTEEELKYWESYGILYKDLKKKNIHSVDKLYVNKQLILNRDGGPRFAYQYGKYIKVYSPFSKSLKWISSCPNDYISGFDDIKNKIFSATQSDKLVITKSLKDEIVLSKFVKDVCSTQNESSTSINEENLKWIRKGYNPENVFIAYDADEPGRKAAKHWEQYGFKSIFILTEAISENCKDWSDVMKLYGNIGVRICLNRAGVIQV